MSSSSSISGPSSTPSGLDYDDSAQRSDFTNMARDRPHSGSHREGASHIEQLRSLRAARRDPSSEDSIGSASDSSSDSNRSSSGSEFDRGQQQAARQIYKRHRLYHGTSVGHDIRGTGFRLAEKERGRTEMGYDADVENELEEGVLERGANHHFFTRDAEVAATVAHDVSVRRDKDPEIVRILGAASAHPFKPDQDGDSTSWCTEHDIEPGFVLGSKHAPAHDGEKVVFQKLLQRDEPARFEHVTEDQAGRLLKTVQSDSDGDNFSVHSLTDVSDGLLSSGEE
jgi:hypothetical protein